MNQLSKNDLDLHVKIIGWLNILGGGFLVLVGALLLAFLPAIGAVSGDPDATAVMGIIGPLVCIFLAALGLPGLVTGYGLLRRKPWARVLAIVVGALNLVNVPIGTVIGAYTIWVMAQESAAEHFASLKAA